MINEKKGIGAGELAAIILILAVAVILLYYGSASAGILKRGGDIEVCRLSALAQAKTKLPGIDVTPVSLKCQRRQVKFFDNKVEINGKKESKYEFKELNNDIVNKVVAEELRICWYMMGEGDVNVFRANLIKHDKICTICSEISFDKNVKQKEFFGLLDFLKREKMPNQDIYYIDYLVKSQRNMYLKVPLIGILPWTQYGPWGYGSTNLNESKEKRKTPASSSFDTSKQYVVYFLGFKPGVINNLLQAFDSAYYIGVGDPQKAAVDCRELVN